MTTKGLTILLGFFVLAGCSSTKSDDFGGSVAVMIDRKFGSSRDAYASDRGIMYSSPGLAHGAKLNSDASYHFTLKFADGHSVETRSSFSAGTSIEDVTTSITKSLQDQGVEVTSVPEFGTFRILFCAGLVEVAAAGSDGLTVVDHMGKRCDIAALGLATRS